MATYVVTFEVSGELFFPLDMLRYDQCYPTDPHAVDRLHDAISEDRFQNPSAKPITLMLSHRSGTKGWLPTASRWHSMSWFVIGPVREVKL